MTVRFDPNRLHASRVTLSVYPGHGILAENAPSNGESGPALGYRAEWFGKEVRFELVTPPAYGTMQLFEDTSFIYTGNGTPDSFELQAYLDGIAEPATETVLLNTSGEAQDHESGGAVTRNVQLVASTAIVQEQEYSSGGMVSKSISAQAVTSFIQEQLIQSAGIVFTSRSAVATTSFVDEFTNEQNHSSGGVVSKTVSLAAFTDWANEQVFQSSGIVSIVRSAFASTTFAEYDSEWGETTVLFAEPEQIQQIALTFDQLGRPLVFYRINTDTLKLYWYDPVLGESVNVAIATGVDPLAGFDFPQDTSQGFSDALLFYVRADTVYMRVQRDRFATEYVCPASEPGLTLTSNGLRVDNRYQVVYQFPDDGYTPPVVPVPPIAVTGDNYYLNSWGSCFVTNHRLDVVSDPFKLGFKVRDAFFPRYSERGDSAFKQGQVMFGSDGRRQFYCYIQRDTRNNSALVNLWRGQREYSAIFELDDFNGEWEFEFRGLSPLVTIRKDGVVIFDGLLARPDPNKAGLSLITFAGAIYSASSSDTYPFHGVQYDCWIEHNSNRIDWPVQTKGEHQQPSVPGGTNMIILNHRPQNWRLIQS